MLDYNLFSTNQDHALNTAKNIIVKLASSSTTESAKRVLEGMLFSLLATLEKLALSQM